MLAMHAQIDRQKAQRMLDLLQVQSAEHMKAYDHRAFVDRLLERCRGAIAAAAVNIERVHWNGTVLATGRAIKGFVKALSEAPV